ncbi:uncharacterized protein LOC113316688 [Papaver somniferum]|uniref:uncharacterized protein LOC113316688 n=1 Tax=Papaver somniferum TaxID=3469 RepID=UPI000E6FBED5|nr:uncharacterized protein LOC113316688 [Papaver somniferum]
MAGPMKVDTRFSVVDAPLPYNAIIGRRWVHRLKRVEATYHQYLMFPTPEEEMEIKGDQVTAKECHVQQNQLNIEQEEERTGNNKSESKDKSIDQYLEEISGKIMTKSNAAMNIEANTSDDILVTGSSTSAINNLLADLSKEFAIKDLGELHFFLGIQASRNSAGLHLFQEQYISNLLHKTKMTFSEPYSTPFAAPTGLDTSPLFDDPTLYRSVVGALQYANITLHDISFAVNKACQHMQSPTEAHWTAVKRILRYLQGTLGFGLHFKCSSYLQVQAFSDVDWAGDSTDRRSTGGMEIFLGPNLIS